MSVGVIIRNHGSDRASAHHVDGRPCLPDELVRVCDGEIAVVMKCSAFVVGLHEPRHQHHDWIINNVVPAMREEGRVLVR